ncbi:Gfo/Idh/MocA family protein [Vitiosangium sp. GDMCC 1.1324]|uniref:Gfo/Idh/MocA family protein n=1 Tax=Vitiosangium sp. (strain GDMCC 1.1324) TaxID=2138576 RepID=UPI000D341607|nr:Gfo/Idh/MocA family oxidoreductase [Vitiosangium sp. GDMCC 1.1324]PTL81388.1 oxidoreductase [Vitiosangium sp. GDMCC 1.1324]
MRKTSPRPRLGFLGVGWIGRNLMEAIVQSEMAQVVGVADPVPAVAQEAQTLTPGSERVDSLDALLELGLDGLVIATPSAFHAEQSVSALERGVAVFCQKPLARSVEETRHVVNAARAADRLLGVDLSYRFTTGMRQLRERIHGGSLGDIYAVNLVFHNAYGPDKAWFYDPKLAGGGCVMDLGIHLVDLAFWVLGFPAVRRVSSQLFAQGRPLRRRGEAVEDYAAAQLELTSGTAVQLACSWKLPAGCDAVIEASFYGTKGGATFRNVNGSFYDFTADLFWGTRRERLADPPDAWGGRAAVDWATRLAHGVRFEPESECLVHVADALDCIYG